MKTKIEKFEDIVAWQKGKNLAVIVYLSFKQCRDFAFKDQIQRAVISISNNIAEGFERQSNKELSKFLYIAKGSCAEVRSMLYVALELKYISRLEFNNLYELSREISRIISGFIKTL